MEYALHYGLLVNFSILLFYGVYALLLRGQTHFTWNRFYLLATLVISFLIPLVELPESTTQAVREVTPALVPEIPAVVNPPQVPETLIQPTNEVLEVSVPTFNCFNLLLGLYLLGVLFQFWQLLRGLAQIATLFFRNPRQRKDSYWEVQLPAGMPPFSFLNVLFWSADEALSEQEAAQIYQHERIHIREWHSLDVLFSELVKVIFWFNPVVYLYQVSLRHLHEYLADAKTAREGHRQLYAELLLRQFLESGSLRLSNHFFNTKLLKQRIQRLHQRPSHPFTRFRILGAIPIIGLAFLVHACNGGDIFPDLPNREDMMLVKTFELGGGDTMTFDYLGLNPDRRYEFRADSEGDSNQVHFVITDHFSERTLYSSRDQKPYNTIFLHPEEYVGGNLKLLTETDKPVKFEVFFGNGDEPPRRFSESAMEIFNYSEIGPSSTIALEGGENELTVPMRNPIRGRKGSVEQPYSAMVLGIIKGKSITANTPLDVQAFTKEDRPLSINWQGFNGYAFTFIIENPVQNGEVRYKINLPEQWGLDAQLLHCEGEGDWD
ncbi:MAG: M56 family metallopeptidase [Bacteroidota bacterium]